jgi:hypothetical protein
MTMSLLEVLAVLCDNQPFSARMWMAEAWTYAAHEGLACEWPF